ncbi:MAG TPA: glucose-6-phosphate dehydrogenase [Thermoplasmata archaeon]|nr:glucose-6-phosphate dehydrogenase [Thermoplasmata archaeon]
MKLDPPAAAPHLFVVFGATGDLFQRKLLPSLHRLATQGKLPNGTKILGVARHDLTDEAFRENAVRSLLEEKAGTEAEVRAFCDAALSFHGLLDESPASYATLRARIESVERDGALPGNRLFYLALPLEGFTPTILGLGEAGLSRAPGWTRIVVEKPFGRDLGSARALNALLRKYFDESQIFRIDHYLGKETVQNLLVFRFANTFVESLWDRDHVERVEITVAEQVGVEARAHYYETSGALRDMVQNHVTQVLALVAMEPPAMRDADTIRNEKVKVLQSVVRLRPDDVVRGQYGAGVRDGAALPAYREETGVAADSDTETYVALRLKIANWRWHDVPFFVRTGKNLPAKSTRVVLTFKAPPVSFFQEEGAYEANPDRITILIQPDEGFELAFEVKVPGREIRVQTERMRFHYADVFGGLPDGYETLLVDVMLGDATLFVRADEVEESWKLYDPILAHPPPLEFYAANTWGPEGATRLAESWGQRWERA